MFYLLLLLYMLPVALIIGLVLCLVKVIIKLTLRMVGWIFRLLWKAFKYLFKTVRLVMG